MDTTLLDLYGNVDNAWSDLKRKLRSERTWSDLTGHEKLEFQGWMLDNAQYYKDGDRIDWVGAFYDWWED